jgi:MFS family permease
LRERLWTSGFVILWQSQLVSTVGDAIYGIALGFWVLSATGSTALMGALMAASTLPGVLIAPVAGVLIDRTAKKRLLI